jgi:predicted metal-dependent phosphoesterase TrpH
MERKEQQDMETETGRKAEIDLHCHSLVSDGSDEPGALARRAKAKGLKAFALTDHDNIAGDEEAWAAAEKLGLGFLPGMELSVTYRGHKLHIVCLGFDAGHPSFKALYRKVRARKEAKIPEIVAFVNKKGIALSMKEVERHAYGPLDRYAVMRALVAKGIYDHAQPYWTFYLDPATEALGLDGPGKEITPEEALPLIHEAGGITSLAHFHKKIGLLGLTREEQQGAIEDLHAMGLDGMEQWYPSYTEEDQALAARMIDRLGLLPTAGTDYHGRNRPEVELGSGENGNMAIPCSLFDAIASRVKKVLLPQA